MIAIKHQGIKIPSKQTLQNCAQVNKDGIGIAYIKAGQQQVRIRKDFKNLKTFYSWLEVNIKPEDIAVIHFRYATHGLVDKGNRHPFPLTRNIHLLRKVDLTSRYAVAHNGILPYGDHKKLSDTQKFIIDILASSKVKNNLHNKTIQKLINHYLDGDKLAILTWEGTVLMFGTYITHTDGCSYSNNSFEPPKAVIYSTMAYNRDKSIEKVDWDKYYKYLQKEDIKFDGSGKKVDRQCDLCGDFKKDVRYYADWATQACKTCRTLYQGHQGY